MKLEAHGRTVDITWDDDSDHIPRRIIETQDFYERGLLEDAWDRAPAGSVVDCGAHIGNHTLFFAGIMGRDVLAFEPNPASYRRLEANVMANGLGHRVRTVRAAVGPVGGWGTLLGSEADNTGGCRVAFRPGDVAVVALDDYRLQDVAVLKVDVEGQAMAALTGALATLERCRPLVYVETDGDERIAELFDELRYTHVGWMGATPTHIWEAVA